MNKKDLNDILHYEIIPDVENRDQIEWAMKFDRNNFLIDLEDHLNR